MKPLAIAAIAVGCGMAGIWLGASFHFAVRTCAIMRKLGAPHSKLGIFWHSLGWPSDLPEALQSRWRR